MPNIDDNFPTTASRISALRRAAERIQGAVREIRPTIAAAQASLISVQSKAAMGAMSSEERAVVDELGPQILIFSQRLVDVAQIVTTRLEVNISELTRELHAATSEADSRRENGALTAAERRMTELHDLISEDMRPNLDVAVSLRTQLAALDEGV